MQISVSNHGSFRTTPASYLLFYRLLLIYGLTDGKVICAPARSPLRNTEQEKRCRRIKSMNENADVIVQPQQSFGWPVSHGASLGCEVTSHSMKDARERKPLLKTWKGGKGGEGEKEKEGATLTSFSQRTYICTCDGVTLLYGRKLTEHWKPARVEKNKNHLNK